MAQDRLTQQVTATASGRPTDRSRSGSPWSTDRQALCSMLPHSAPASSRSGRKPSLLTRINHHQSMTPHCMVRSARNNLRSDSTCRGPLPCHPCELPSLISTLHLLLFDVDSEQLNSSSVVGTTMTVPCRLVQLHAAAASYPCFLTKPGRCSPCSPHLTVFPCFLPRARATARSCATSPSPWPET